MKILVSLLFKLGASKTVNPKLPEDKDCVFNIKITTTSDFIYKRCLPCGFLYVCDSLCVSLSKPQYAGI